MQMEHYQKYNVASVMSECPEVYTSIALAVVWISFCFTLSLGRKLQKHEFIGVNETPGLRAEKRFGDENGTFKDACICVSLCVIKPE